jgi:bifunctional non-homologous end joining protein LigD
VGRLAGPTLGRRQRVSRPRAAKDYELEGVVAKRLDGRYVAGRRSRSWVKVKRFQRAQVVVMGWVPWRNGHSRSAGRGAIGPWR